MLQERSECFSRRSDRLSGLTYYRQHTPREVDPVVRALPDVLALHQGLGLLVDDRGADLGGGVEAEVPYQFERLAGVGDVIGDEDLLVGEVDGVGDRGQ